MNYNIFLFDSCYDKQINNLLGVFNVVPDSISFDGERKLYAQISDSRFLWFIANFIGSFSRKSLNSAVDDLWDELRKTAKNMCNNKNACCSKVQINLEKSPDPYTSRDGVMEYFYRQLKSRGQTNATINCKK